MHQMGVQRVTFIGPVERQHEDRALALAQYKRRGLRVIGHRGKSPYNDCATLLSTSRMIEQRTEEAKCSVRNAGCKTQTNHSTVAAAAMRLPNTGRRLQARPGMRPPTSEEPRSLSARGCWF